MKIHFLIRGLAIGGAQRQLANPAIGLKERGHQITVLTMYPGGGFQGDLEAAGVRVVSLAKRNRYDVLGFFWRLVRLLRRERPDVLHGYLDAAKLFFSVP